jgi:hypothetical protein
MVFLAKPIFLAMSVHHEARRYQVRSLLEAIEVAAAILARPDRLLLG